MTELTAWRKFSAPAQEEGNSVEPGSLPELREQLKVPGRPERLAFAGERALKICRGFLSTIQLSINQLECGGRTTQKDKRD